MSQRIVLVGDLRPHTRTRQRHDTLVELGHDVRAVPTVPLDRPAPDGEAPPIVHRLRARVGLPPDLGNANACLLEALERGPCDVIWIEQALSLRPAILRTARGLRRDARCAFFSEDDMLPRRNGSLWFRRSLDLYDVVFTTKSFNASPAELPRLGAPRVVYVPKTFDPHLHRPVEVRPEDAERLGAPVGFIGTYEPGRARSLTALAHAGIPVRVWGHGWSSLSDRPPGLRLEERTLHGEERVRSLCSTDVNLGFLRESSRELHTARSVEVPACGAFLLAERTREHSQLFEEGIEADFFLGPDQLVERVRHHLAHPEERVRIARRGRERCLDSGYDHASALEHMLEELGSPRRLWAGAAAA